MEYAVKPATPAARLAEEREVKKACGDKQRGSEFRRSTAYTSDKGTPDSQADSDYVKPR